MITLLYHRIISLLNYQIIILLDDQTITLLDDQRIIRISLSLTEEHFLKKDLGIQVYNSENLLTQHKDG